MSPWSAILWESNWLRSMKKNEHKTRKKWHTFQSLVSMASNSNLTWDNYPLSSCKNRLKRLAGLCIQGLVQKRPKMIQIKFFRHPVRSVYCLQSIKKVATAEPFFGALSWLSFVNITSERLFWRAIGLCLATLKIPGVWLAREVSLGSLKIGLGIHNHWGKLYRNQF